MVVSLCMETMAAVKWFSNKNKQKKSALKKGVASCNYSSISIYILPGIASGSVGQPQVLCP